MIKYYKAAQTRTMFGYEYYFFLKDGVFDSNFYSIFINSLRCHVGKKAMTCISHYDDMVEITKEEYMEKYNEVLKKLNDKLNKL